MAGAFQSNAFQNNAFQVDVGAPQGVTVGLIDQTAVVFAPSVVYTQFYTPALIDQTAVAFAPQLDHQYLFPGFIDQTAAPFAPTSVQVSTYGRTYQAPIEIAVAPTSGMARTYQVPVDVAIQNLRIIALGLIDQTAAAFTPTITGGVQVIDVGLIDRTAVAHSPSISLNVTLGLINQAAVGFTPTITGGTYTIVVDPIDQTATTFTPSFSWDKFVFPGHIDRRAIPFNPAISGGVTLAPNASPATVVIRYDGTNITEDVVIVGANFTSQANGVAGTCQFKIKDPDHTYSLTTGKRLTLDINGQRVWTGYVSKVSRVYAFKAQDTSNPSLVTRFLQVEGSDINILFRKRIVFEKANPKRLFGRKYTADNTDDTVAFADLVEDFLDLSGDNLDTSTLIENVGTINVDHPANPIGVGHDWASSMRSITALSNGVYYIDPDRKVVLTDVDTPNAPFDLSDDPADNAVGYREMEVLHNASNMVNDMIVWGAGGGSGTMVYSREEDATSISTHGRWQAGEFRGDMYKQGTVNRRADSIVQGSAQSKRGAKDDQVTVAFVTYEPGLRVAQKIDFTSAAFGFSDVLPIRRMTVTFLTPTRPKYSVVAGHEIDMPWGFFDIWRPKFPPFDLPGFSFPGYEIPGIDIDIPDPDGGCECTDEICGMTETFERTLVGEFGTSDSGLEWTTTLGGSALGSFDVAFGKGFIYTPGSSAGDTATATLGGAVPNEHYTAWDPTAIKTLRFQWSNIAWTSSDLEYVVNWATIQRLVGGPLPSIYRLGANGWRLRTTGGPTDGVAIPDGFWSDSTIYTWTVEDIGGSTIETSITDGVTTYSTTGTYSEPIVRCIVSTSSSLQTPFAASDRSFIILDIDIPEINSCSEYHFDNFNRSTASGSFGVSDSGFAWSQVTALGSATAIVDGSYATITVPAQSSAGASAHQREYTIDGGVWQLPDAWSMYSRVKPISAAGLSGFNETRFFLDDNSGDKQMITLDPNGDQLRYVHNNVEIDQVSGVVDSGNWNIFRWTYYPETDSFGVAVWPEAGSDPGDQLTFISQIDRTIAVFGIGANRSSLNFPVSAATHQWDWIDFDYEGAPCNGAFTDITVIDDFSNRTLTDDLGTASGGYLYDDVFISGVATTQINADHLRLEVDNTNLGQLFAFFYFDPFSSLENYPMALQNEGIFSFRFRTNAVQANGVPSKTSLIIIRNEINTASFDQNQWVVGVSANNDTGDGWLRIHNSHSVVGDPGEFVKTDWLENTWYVVELLQLGATIAARVYEDGDTPPDWQVIEPVNRPFPWIADTDPDTGFCQMEIQMEVQEATGSGSGIGQLDLDDIAFTERGCSPETTVVPTSGRVCEDFTGDGTTIDFFTSQVQKWGQTTVTINGSIQQISTQITNDDAELKGVRLLSAPSAGASITVCYYVGETIAPTHQGPG